MLEPMLTLTTAPALLLVLSPAAPGGGGTIEQTGPLPGTGTGQLEDFQLNQFDPQGGALKLDSVTLELFTSLHGGGTTNTSGVPTSYTASLNADLLLGAQPLVETEALVSGVVPNTGPVIAFSVFDTDSGQAVLTTPAELTPWIGGGTITLTSFTDLFVDEQPANTIFFGAGGGSTYTVTYAYSDVAESYCTPGTSASGCKATLAAAGTPSATAGSGFQISAADVEGGKDGLFYFGTGGRQANPWGNGTSLQCAVPPVSRAGLLIGTGAPGGCGGAFAQDLNAFWCPTCPKPGKNPGAGAVVQAQLWYRDPQNTSNRTTSLSDALEFTVGP